MHIWASQQNFIGSLCTKPRSFEIRKGRKVPSVWNLLIPLVNPKTRVNRLQRYLFSNPDKDVWLCIRQMQLQVNQGRGRIEWHNAVQACDLEYILQISATGKAAAMLSLPQKTLVSNQES